MIKAVLFDVDGTLLDTKEFVYQAYEHVLKSYDFNNVSRNEITLVMGEPLEKCYEVLTGLNDVGQLVNEHREFQLNNLGLSKPFKNATPVLKKIKENGIKIAAITTRSKITSVKTLKNAGLLEYIDTVISGEDVINKKPNPEGLIKSLEIFNVSRDEAVMVGDTKVDVLAGKNAKVKTIGIMNGFHGERLRESNPDFIVSDIEDILQIILSND
jgi:pyrophosphatase PpaX